MPIQQDNIKFLESQVMDDVPEGGGASTGNQIIDGAMNNIFEDISDTDRAYGRFNLRKIFLGVESLDTSLFGGVKTVITALPTDDAVAYTLFDTGSPFDTRADAADKVEAYLYKSATWHGYLNENHIEGMTAISVIQKVGTALPPIGKTLCIVQDEGLAGEKEQYVRAIDVSTTTVTIDDAQGSFERMIVTLTLSDALRFDFNGHTIARSDASYNYTNKARIRDTRVADATRYFSTQPLVEAASVGDLSVKAASIYTQLVPSAQSETPLVNKTLAPVVTQMRKLRETAITVPYETAVGGTAVLQLPTGIFPSTLSFFRSSGITYTDDGNGKLMQGTAVVGTVDYITGEIRFTGGEFFGTYLCQATYIPAVQVSQQAHTRAVDVTAENRRLNWTETLLPLPERGSLVVSYMSLGNWYTLTDDGSGTLAGDDPALGAGTVSYVTGAMLVSLGALPDADSKIIISWGSPVHYADRSASNAIDKSMEIRFALGESIKPTEFSISWTSGGVTKTATADIAGVITGHATGYINYSSGEFTLKTTLAPDAATSFTVTAKKQTQVTVIKTGVSAPSGLATIDLGEAILAGSLSCEWSTVSTLKRNSSETTVSHEFGTGI